MRAAGLSEWRVVLVRGALVEGSGYVVAAERVLTVAHVLEAGGTVAVGAGCSVRAWGGEWMDGRVAWVSPPEQLDLALIQVGGLGVGAGAVLLGRLGEIEDGTGVLQWAACGYPRAALGNVEHVVGEVPVASRRQQGQMALTIRTSDAIDTSHGPGWSGLSGAAVFVVNRLVGVITSDRQDFDRSLVAIRVEQLAEDSSFAAALGGELRIDRVRSAPIDSVLADMTQLFLPPRDQSFTGRMSDLEQLAVEPSGGAVILTHLVGLGGIGKTALATEFAHRCLEHPDYDVVWWFNAADRATLAETMSSVYGRLASGEREPADPELGAQLLCNWLRTTTYRWLVVFDNADTHGVLDRLNPTSPKGRVVITPRISWWDGAAVRPVGVLPDADGVHLLNERSGRDDDDAGALRVVQVLGCLPLAIEQAGALIRQTGWAYDRYLDELRERGVGLHDDPADLETTVFRVLDTSRRHVAERASDPHLVDTVLGLLACWAADEIPERLLRSPVIEGEPLLADVDEQTITSTLVQLDRFSLVNRRGGSVSLHRLVQQLVRGQLGRREREYAEAAFRLVRSAMADEAAADPAQIVHSLPHLASAVDHLRALDRAPPRPVSQRGLVGRIKRNRQLRQIARWNALASGARAKRRASEATAFLGRVLAGQSRLLGNDHPTTLATRSELLSSFEAPATVELARLVRDHERVLGPHHRDTLRSRLRLAQALMAQGEYGAAGPMLDATRAAQVEHFGADDEDVLATRGSIVQYLAAVDSPAAAVTESTALINDMNRLLNPFDRRLLHAHHNLATYLSELGRLDEAIARLEQTLTIENRFLGPDDPLTITTRGSLAALAQAPAALHVLPARVDFGVVPHHTPASQVVSIDIVGVGTLTWTHSQTGDFFTTERTDEGHLRVTVVGVPGKHRAQLAITSAGGTVDVDVVADIRRDWIWTRHPVAVAVAATIAVLPALIAIGVETNPLTDDDVVTDWTFPLEGWELDLPLTYASSRQRQAEARLDSVLAAAGAETWERSPHMVAFSVPGCLERTGGILTPTVSALSSDGAVLVSVSQLDTVDGAWAAQDNVRDAVKRAPRDPCLRLSGVTVSYSSHERSTGSSGRVTDWYDLAVERADASTTAGAQVIVADGATVLDAACWRDAFECQSLLERLTNAF